MAISHIPRSVGHNFAPEYQISAIPFCFKLKNTTSSNIRSEMPFIYKITTGLAVASVASDGSITITDNNVSANDIKQDDAGELNKNNLNTADFTLLYKISFPKITSWIQFLNTGNNTMETIYDGSAGANITDKKFYFNTKNAAKKDEFHIRIIKNEISPIYPYRITALYYHDSTNHSQDVLNIRAGLTTIDANQFDEVVETFLDVQH